MGKKSHIGNRKYKDSAFRRLYHNPKRASELYYALTGENIDPGEIIFASLGGLFTSKMNHDVAFFIGQRLIILLEHQSTQNENMPLRMLIYIAKLYERYVRKLGKRSLYQKKLLMLPTPEFFLFYNGKPEEPGMRKMRLSDAFSPDHGTLELVVTMYNINGKKSIRLLHDCPTLHGYSVLVDQVETYRPLLGLDQAIARAIDYCKKHTALKEFLEENEAEVYGAMFQEWNLEDALEVRKEEGIEEGIEKGRDSASIDYIKNLMQTVHWTAQQAMDALGIPLDKQKQYMEILSAQS